MYAHLIMKKPKLHWFSILSTNLNNPIFTQNFQLLMTPICSISAQSHYF